MVNLMLTPNAPHGTAFTGTAFTGAAVTGTAFAPTAQAAAYGARVIDLLGLVARGAPV